MKIREACEILTNRLRDERGLERTPKQLFAFLHVRLIESNGRKLTDYELSWAMFSVLQGLLGSAEQFNGFADDMRDSTTIGPHMEGVI